MKKQSGFIHALFVIAAIAIVLLFFGKNPLALWEIIKPFIVFIFELFLKIIEWIIKFITQVWQNN